jgi:hypothetical protein
MFLREIPEIVAWLNGDLLAGIGNSVHGTVGAWKFQFGTRENQIRILMVSIFLVRKNVDGPILKIYPTENSTFLFKQEGGGSESGNINTFKH